MRVNLGVMFQQENHRLPHTQACVLCFDVFTLPAVVTNTLARSSGSRGPINVQPVMNKKYTLKTLKLYRDIGPI